MERGMGRWRERGDKERGRERRCEIRWERKSERNTGERER